MTEWWQGFFEGRWIHVQLDWAAALTAEEIDALESRRAWSPDPPSSTFPAVRGGSAGRSRREATA